MPTIIQIAEGLAVLYGYLLEQEDALPSAVMDRLFDTVAELDRACGGIDTPVVRSILDDSSHSE
jgi:hypothetical protein